MEGFMWKAIVLVFLLLTSCGYVVKPTYIEPEKDLEVSLKKDFDSLDKKPTRKSVERILSNSKVYLNRTSYKIKKNNERALK